MIGSFGRAGAGRAARRSLSTAPAHPGPAVLSLSTSSFWDLRRRAIGLEPVVFREVPERREKDIGAVALDSAKHGARFAGAGVGTLD